MKNIVFISKKTGEVLAEYDRYLNMNEVEETCKLLKYQNNVEVDFRIVDKIRDNDNLQRRYILKITNDIFNKGYELFGIKRISLHPDDANKFAVAVKLKERKYVVWICMINAANQVEYFWGSYIDNYFNDLSDVDLFEQAMFAFNKK